MATGRKNSSNMKKILAASWPTMKKYFLPTSEDPTKKNVPEVNVPEESENN